MRRKEKFMVARVDYRCHQYVQTSQGYIHELCKRGNWSEDILIESGIVNCIKCLNALRERKKEEIEWNTKKKKGFLAKLFNW